MKLYGFPALPQAGLGNMLIPWADCMLWCKDNAAPMISPFWTRPRIGPWLRRERDKRLYHRLFVPAGQVHGLQRFVLLARSARVSAEQWRAGQAVVDGRKPLVVSFSNMNLFETLIGRATEVRAALYQMTRPRYQPPRQFGRTPFVGIHVRRGDYPRQSDGHQIVYQLPIAWYTQCLQQLREALEHELPAVVFSDGDDLELAPLLSLPGVSRSPFSEAITDLLALAQGAVIITSRSTFSLWGVYLGQVPSIWYPPKQEICGRQIVGSADAGDIELEWLAGDLLPPRFVQNVQSRIDRKAEHAQLSDDGQ